METKESYHVKNVWGNLHEKCFIDVLSKQLDERIALDIENSVGIPPFSGNIQVETTPREFFSWLEVGISRPVISYTRSDGDEVYHCSDNVSAWTRRHKPNDRSHPVQTTTLTVRGHADAWPSIDKRNKYPRLVAPFAKEVNQVDHFSLALDYRVAADCNIEVKDGNAIFPKRSATLALEGRTLEKDLTGKIDSLRYDILHIYRAMSKIPTDYTIQKETSIKVGNNDHVF